VPSDWQVRDGAHGINGRSGLVPVAKCLENEEVDSTFDQCRGLLAEVLAGFVDAGLAPGLDAHAQRPDGSGHIDLVAGGLPGQPRAGDVERMGFVAKAKGAQLES
jgi:hypothetical protein